MSTGLRLFIIAMSIAALHAMASLCFGTATYLYTQDWRQTQEAIVYVNQMISIVLFLTIGIVSCYYFALLIWAGIRSVAENTFGR